MYFSSRKYGSSSRKQTSALRTTTTRFEDGSPSGNETDGGSAELLNLSTSREDLSRAASRCSCHSGESNIVRNDSKEGESRAWSSANLKLELDNNGGSDDEQLKDELLRIFDREKVGLESYFKQKTESILQNYRRKQYEWEENLRVEKIEYEKSLAQEKIEVQQNYISEMTKLTKQFNQERVELESHYKKQVSELSQQFEIRKKEMDETIIRERTELKQRLEMEYQSMLSAQRTSDEQRFRQQRTEVEEDYQKRILELEQKLKKACSESELSGRRMQSELEATFEKERAVLVVEWRKRVELLELELGKERERANKEERKSCESHGFLRTEITKKEVEIEKLRQVIGTLKDEVSKEKKTAKEFEMLQQNIFLQGSDALPGKLRDDFEKMLAAHREELERTLRKEREGLESDRERRSVIERETIEKQLRVERERMSLAMEKEREDMRRATREKEDGLREELRREMERMRTALEAEKKILREQVKEELNNERMTIGEKFLKEKDERNKEMEKQFGRALDSQEEERQKGLERDEYKLWATNQKMEHTKQWVVGQSSVTGDTSGPVGYNRAGSEGKDYRGAEGKDYRGSEGKDYRRSEGKDYRGSEGKDYRGSEWKDYRGSEEKDYRGSEEKDYRGSEGKDYRRSEGKDYRVSEGKDYRESEGKDCRGSEGKVNRGSEGKDYRGSEGKDYRGSEGKVNRVSEGKDYRGSEGKDYRRSEGKDYKGSEGKDYKGSEGKDYRGSEGEVNRGSEGKDHRGSEGKDKGSTVLSGDESKRSDRHRPVDEFSNTIPDKAANVSHRSSVDDKNVTNVTVNVDNDKNDEYGLRGLEEENEGLKTKVDALQENIKLHECYKTEAGEEIERLRKANKELKVKLQEMKERVKNYEERLEDDEEKIKEYEGICDEYEKCLHECREKILMIEKEREISSVGGKTRSDRGRRSSFPERSPNDGGKLQDGRDRKRQEGLTARDKEESSESGDDGLGRTKKNKHRNSKDDAMVDILQTEKRKLEGVVQDLEAKICLLEKKISEISVATDKKDNKTDVEQKRELASNLERVRRQNRDLVNKVKDLQFQLQGLVDKLRKEKKKVTYLQTEYRSFKSGHQSEIKELQKKLEYSGTVIARLQSATAESGTVSRLQEEISTISRLMMEEHLNDQRLVRARSVEDMEKSRELDREKGELERKLQDARSALDGYSERLKNKVSHVDMAGSQLSLNSGSNLFLRDMRLSKTIQALEESQKTSLRQNERLLHEKKELQSLIGRLCKSQEDLRSFGGSKLSLSSCGSSMSSSSSLDFLDNGRASGLGSTRFSSTFSVFD